MLGPEITAFFYWPSNAKWTLSYSTWPNFIKAWASLQAYSDQIIGP